MSDPFVGEIRMFAGGFAPRGNALCDGQLLGVAQYDALFSLFGTIYGGDGRTTFGLPDLRGRVPMHHGSGPGLTPRNLGARFGVENVQLTTQQIPAHTHTWTANSQAGQEGNPTNNVPAQSTTFVYRRAPAPLSIRPLNDNTLTPQGQGQQHTNLMPFQCINFIVALSGVYPSRT